MEKSGLVLETTKGDYDSDLLYLGFSDKWMLLLVSLVFLVVTIMVFIMSVKTRKQVDSDCTFYYLIINKDQSVVFPKGQVRDGIYFKTIFLDFLCLTCLSKWHGGIWIWHFHLARSIGSAIILGVEYTESLYWLYLVMSSLPSLLFFSSFSLFIYFFARVVMEEESDSTNLLKPFFIVFNAFTYVAFISMAIYSN